MIQKIVSCVLMATISINVNVYNLSGGSFPTKSASLWKLHKYKYTTLLRAEPLCWCPYKSYVLVDEYVIIENRANMNWLTVKTNLVSRVRDDAKYNKSHAPIYHGTNKSKVRKIYNFCKRTKYVAHVKTARDVIEKRQGDCAGIAAAFYVLCKKNKIPVRYVIGWTKTSCHAWNKVYIKGRWYWIDPTHELWLSKKQYPNRTVLEMW